MFGFIWMNESHRCEILEFAGTEQYNLMFWVRSAGAWLVPGRLLLAGSALTEQQPQQPSSRTEWNKKQERGIVQLDRHYSRRYA